MLSAELSGSPCSAEEEVCYCSLAQFNSFQMFKELIIIVYVCVCACNTPCRPVRRRSPAASSASCS